MVIGYRQFINEDYQKTVTAYKLFRTSKKHPGKLFPLFIGKNKPVEQNKWVDAENQPTKGFASRPGWHAGSEPNAPHLRNKQNRIAADRVWAKVSMPADKDYNPEAKASKTRDIRGHVPTGGHYTFNTSKKQGKKWLIGGSLKVDKVMSDRDVFRHHMKSGDKEAARSEVNWKNWRRT